MSKAVRLIFFFWLFATVSSASWAGDFEDGLEAYNNGEYIIAFNKWKKAAEQGDAKAQFKLGQLYESDLIFSSDNSSARSWQQLKAIELYIMAAEQGLAEAQFHLGVHYFITNRSGAYLIKLAAEQGHPAAQSVLGEMYSDWGFGPYSEEKISYVEAVKWFRLAAEQGVAYAQYRLGLAYYLGNGVLQDDKEAAKWYRLAAEQGYADAQYRLGLAYYLGNGVLQDYKEAVKWYRLAAEQGDASAQLKLGVMYANGEGLIQDNIYAHMWFNIAASNGELKGSENRGKIQENMTKEDISLAQKLARECVAKGYKDC